MRKGKNEPVSYEEVMIFDVLALFSDGRIAAEEVPKGLFRFDLRGSDYDPGWPVMVERRVGVNHAGTLLMSVPIHLPKKGWLSLGDEFYFTGRTVTAEGFRKEHMRMGMAEAYERMENAIARANEDVALMPDPGVCRYALYQLASDGGGEGKRFMGWDSLQREGESVVGAEYGLVYSGILPDEETLDGIYERFNLSHPEGYVGHSLSVGDVIVLNRNGEARAHFVDSIGFVELPDFVQQRLRVAERSRDSREGEWEEVREGSCPFSGKANDSGKKPSILEELKEGRANAGGNQGKRKKQGLKKGEAELG